MEQSVRRRRVAKGPKRPQYLATAELDKFMMMFTALLSEFSALRDRVDSHELLAERDMFPRAAAVEAHVLSAGERQAREAARMAMLNRVMRIILEEREEAQRAIDSADLDQLLTEELAS